METWRLADLHAYVDDCLEPDERRAFEKQMAEDPALARRAAVWRAQNNAIRSAFDGEGARAFSISIVRHQNGARARADDQPRSAAKLRANSCRGRHRRALRASRNSRRRQARRELFEPRCRCGLASPRCPFAFSPFGPQANRSSPLQDSERPASRRSAHSPVRTPGPLNSRPATRQNRKSG